MQLLQLRFLIPGLLTLTGIANVGFRFLPPDHIALRSWEVVTLFLTSSGPFASNKHYVNSAAPGDLGTLANLPQFRYPHAETFTTGRHGYRGYEPDKDGPPAAILFGDSFGAGASLCDEDSLCARLGPVFGGPVFFAAYYSPKAVAKLAALPRAPYVILQLSERFTLSDAPSGGQGVAGFIRGALGEGSDLFIKIRYLNNLLIYSPLEIWAGRAYRYLQNDEILPNVHASNVDRYTLRDHLQLLVLHSELTNRLSPPPVELRDLTVVEHRIEAQGFRVLVVLVPNKLTVYSPFIPDLPPGPPEDRLYINVLEAALRQASIPVVNLTPSLRRAAAAALAQNELVYYPDDTHWNAAGVRAASEEISRFLNHQNLAH